MGNKKKTFFKDEWDDLRAGNIALIGVIVTFILITIFSSFSTIKSGEVGLKVRFGKIINSKLDEGFNLKIPYVEKIVKVNIKVQKAEIVTESSSADLQTIKTNLAVNYRVIPAKAPNLYKTVGNSYEQTILDPAIKESIKSVLAQYNAQDVIVKRAEVSQKCMESLQNKIKKYGIEIDNFNITNLSFSEEYNKAIEDKQVSEQKLEKSRLDAEAKLVEAQATKEANELMKQTLTKEIIMKQFIDKWNGELPKVSGNENMLDISSLLGN